MATPLTLGAESGQSGRRWDSLKRLCRSLGWNDAPQQLANWIEHDRPDYGESIRAEELRSSLYNKLFINSASYEASTTADSVGLLIPASLRPPFPPRCTTKTTKTDRKSATGAPSSSGARTPRQSCHDEPIKSDSGSNMPPSPAVNPPLVGQDPSATLRKIKWYLSMFAVLANNNEF